MGSYKADEAVTMLKAVTDVLIGDLHSIARHWSDVITADPYKFAQWCEELGLTFDLTPETTHEGLILQYIFQPRPVYGGVQ